MCTGTESRGNSLEPAWPSIQTKRVSTSGTELYSTRGSTPGNHPPEETVISSSSISPSILELWGTMVSSCTASTVDAWMPSSRSTSEINTGLGNSNTCSPSSCLTVTIMCCRRLNRLMSNSMVDGPLPRSHSPVLRWIRNPLSLGRGGSNPSLGANIGSLHHPLRKPDAPRR